MRRSSIFTEEQIQTLKTNPNTAKLTESRISLTIEAKREIIKLNQEGKTPREIVVHLGYDPVILGKFRTRNMVRNVLRDVELGACLHEGYLRTKATRMDVEMIQQLDSTPSSYAKLKNEVIYLRKEVEFLKKISQQVISGKRGK